MPLLIIAAIAIVLYVAYRILAARKGDSAAMGPLTGDPAYHTDSQIIRSMKAYWRNVCEEQYQLHMRAISLAEEEDEAFRELRKELEATRRSSVDVYSVERHDNGSVTAFVTIRVPGYRPLGPSPATCVFQDGYWSFTNEASESDAGEGQFVVIGEPVVLQTSWKEPPFAVTVLDCPERVDLERVRVPVRYTGIIHRWSHSSVGAHTAFLYTTENAAGERVAWESEYENPWGSDFEEFVLIEGGTYDRHIYFRAREGEEQRTVPRRRFVELHWLDDSETEIVVDMSKRVEPANRIRFHSGVPERRLDKSAFDAWLRNLGSQWAGLGEAPDAGIGDVLKLAPSGDGRWDLTVLGPPERVTDEIVRLPVRVVSRFRDARPFIESMLQIGTTPDEFGVIRHLWEPRDFEGEGGMPDDCLHRVEVKQNAVREGAVYFSPPRHGKPEELPAEPFTTLWYGVNYMEMPVSLTPNA